MHRLTKRDRQSETDTQADLCTDKDKKRQIQLSKVTE